MDLTFHSILSYTAWKADGTLSQILPCAKCYEREVMSRSLPEGGALKPISSVMKGFLEELVFKLGSKG